ncbi:MAG: S41 family peptidase [Bacteroidetes bacterium]|nr:S41 family peptidase [Bacteroidota bacterium]
MEIRLRIPKALAMAVLAFILSTGFRVYDDLFEFSKNLEIFSAAYKEVGKNFVDEVNPGILMRRGLDAMLAGLDPYTVYYSENQTEESLIDRQGEYGGVGCRVIIRDEYPMVSEVFGGYAFSTADIRTGDLLKSIAGQSMKGKSIPDVGTYLRGAPNTSLNIVIEREGVEMNKTITRMQVRSKNVPYYGMIDGQTGYVKLEEFGQNAASEIDNAIVSMKKDGKLKQIILDLRENGGGLLNEAVNIVGLFTGPGKLVVTMKGRTRESYKEWITQAGNNDREIPLVVLVNSHSASASEVVSGSLQDMDRAVIVGRQSFGKGLVQNFFQLPYRTQMKITTAKYYTPSGRCIQLLDYSKRNPDGSAGTIPDSLRRAFKTVGGRTVYDGGGIRPDVPVNEFAEQPLLKLMLEEFVLFDYANHYRNSHDKIENARSFHLTEEEFEGFVKTAEQKTVDVVKKKLKDQILKGIEDKVLAEKLIAGMQMETMLGPQIRERIQFYHDALKYMLEQEILERYYFGDAIYEHSFSGDPDIKEALSVFNDPGRLKRILSKP